MAGATGLFARWLRILGFGLDPFEVAVRRAQAKLNRTILVGTPVPEATSRSIVEAAEAVRAGTRTRELELAFYREYARLTKLIRHLDPIDDEGPANALRDALDDAELLLKFAAEAGVPVSKEIVEPLLAAVAAYREETLTNAQTASFYEAYK